MNILKKKKLKKGISKVLNGESLLDYANKNYPIGTFYIDADTENPAGEKEVSYELEHNEGLETIGDGAGGYVYFKGVWAKVTRKVI